MVYECVPLTESASAALSENISTYQLLIDTGAASGECAGILDVGYLRSAHQRRQRIIEAAGSASLDGRPTTPERLYSWLGDVPLQAQPNLGAEAYAAEMFAALNDVGATAFRDEAVELAERARVKVGRDVLGGAGILFGGRDSITSESRAAYAIFLRGILGPAEPALSPFLGGAEAAARRSAGAFDRYMAERLAKAARRSLVAARTLRSGLAAANLMLARDRSSSHIRSITELLFAGHPLSVSSAAKIFDISRLAARKHLLRLERDGLVEAASRGKTGVVYVARDGLMTFQAPAPSPRLPPKPTSRLAVSTGTPLTVEERARLDAVADDVAERVRDLDRLLLRLSLPAGKDPVSRG
jgi:hypothetical protein